VDLPDRGRAAGVRPGRYHLSVDARSFPPQWFTPTPEAYRAAAAISEGFCPYPHCGSRLGVNGYCPACGVVWGLTSSGFSGSAHEVADVTRKVTVYPFATWQRPATDLARVAAVAAAAAGWLVLFAVALFFLL
jgi:hypothetical protein